MAPASVHPARVGRPQRVTKQAIIESAIELLAKGSLDSVSIRAIAANLGVGAMTIYRHFKNKQEILQHLPEALLAELCSRIRAMASTSLALQALADGLIEIMQRNPQAARLFEQPVVGPNMTAAWAHLTDLLIEDGLPQDHAVEVVRAIVAQVIGESITSHGTGQQPRLGVRLLLAGVEAQAKVEARAASTNQQA